MRQKQLIATVRRTKRHKAGHKGAEQEQAPACVHRATSQKLGSMLLASAGGVATEEQAGDASLWSRACLPCQRM